MNDQELAGLKSLSGPSATLRTKAELYMKDTAERKKVDEYDAANGTAIGPKLKRIWNGQPEEAPAPVAKPQPTAVQLADAVKKYPKERCHNLFVGQRTPSGETRHSESSSKLTKEEYAAAKMAAQFFGVIPTDGSGATVKFVYSTTRDRAAKRAQKEADEKAVQERVANELPPGIVRDADGGLSLADAQAFSNWKAEREANKNAIAFLEQQAA